MKQPYWGRSIHSKIQKIDFLDKKSEKMGGGMKKTNFVASACPYGYM